MIGKLKGWNKSLMMRTPCSVDIIGALLQRITRMKKACIQAVFIKGKRRKIEIDIGTFSFSRKYLYEYMR